MKAKLITKDGLFVDIFSLAQKIEFTSEPILFNTDRTEAQIKDEVMRMHEPRENKKVFANFRLCEISTVDIFISKPTK